MSVSYIHTYTATHGIMKYTIVFGYITYHVKADCLYAPWTSLLAIHHKLLAKLVTSNYEDTAKKIVFESICC